MSDLRLLLQRRLRGMAASSNLPLRGLRLCRDGGVRLRGAN